MKITHDNKLGAWYFYIFGIEPLKSHRQQKFPTPNGDVILDFNKKGEVIGIEVLE